MAEDNEVQGGNKTASLMISYSRKDTAFVKQLYHGLVAAGFPPGKESIWVDWEGIPLSADWMAEITKGIQSANAFIFVISPDSVASEVCQREIEIAVASNKRFIPILYREPGRDAKLHEKISSHNWIFIHDEKELEKNLPALVSAINTDLDWLAQHTRLYNRATEWADKGRNDSYLVRGNDLQDAEAFISEGAAGKDPSPTPLHVEYVKAAQKYAANVRRRNRIIAAVVGVALLALSIVSIVNWIKADEQKEIAEQNFQEAEKQRLIAEDAKQEAEQERNEAVRSQRIANANVLAAEAVNQQHSDSQLSLILALLSIQETEIDGPPLLESQSALFTSLNTPNVLHTWETDSVVWDTAFDPTGRFAAIGGDTGVVQVFDIETRELAYSFQVGESITALDFSPDGSRIGVVSEVWTEEEDTIAQITDIESGEVVFTLAGHDGAYINDIDFSPDGQLIATAGDDNLVKIWFADSGTIKTTLFGHEDYVIALDFSPDSTRLISGGQDSTVILWDIAGGSYDTLRSENIGSITAVSFSPNGDRIMAGAYKSVVVWDAFSREEIQQLSGNRASLYDVDFSPDSSSMFTSSSGIKVFDWVNGLERFNLSAHSGEVNSVAFSADGNLMVTGSWDYTAKLWAANLKIETLRLKEIQTINSNASYSPDGKWIAVVGNNGQILIYDALTGDVMYEYFGYDVLFNPQNSGQILTFDGTNLYIWNIGESEPTRTFTSGENEINSASFSADGKQVLAVDWEGVFKTWDVENGEGPLIWDNVYLNDILDVWSGEDGNFLLTNYGSTANIWNLDDLSAEPLLLEGHLDNVLAGAFSHDGKYIYTGGYDNTIRKWDAKNGGDALAVIPGHTGRILGIDVSPDGTLIASASADTTVRVWEVETGKEKYTYRGNSEDANSVVFSPDGKKVLTASSDYMTKEFVIDFAALKQIAFEYELRQLTKEECLRFLKRDNCNLRFAISAPSNEDQPGGGDPGTADEPQLKSGDGSTPVTLLIQNNASFDVNIFWVDFEGLELLYYTAAPGDVIEQGTYSTHAWRVRDLDGKLIQDYISTEDTEQILDITGSGPAAPAPDSTSDDATASEGGSFYTEDFSSDLGSSWETFMVTGLDQQVDTSVKNGNLSIQLSIYEETPPRYYRVNADSIYSNVQLEITTTNNGNNANRVSLVCHYGDDGWYEFTISNGGFYWISAYVQSLGDYVNLAEGGAAQINTGRVENTIVATCDGNNLSLEVNGFMLNSLTDTVYSYTGGNIGFGVAAPDLLPVDVSLDTLIVREP